MRSLKHFTNAPFPPFLYLNSNDLHLAQKISTVRVGPFEFGLAKGVFLLICGESYAVVPIQYDGSAFILLTLKRLSCRLLGADIRR